MAGGADKTDGEVLVRKRTKAVRPKRFRVLLYNDDYTTMEFVVEILMGVFRHAAPEAVTIMFKVHEEGRGVAGVYPHDIAESKVLEVHSRARNAGYPLRCGMEEE